MARRTFLRLAGVGLVVGVVALGVLLQQWVQPYSGSIPAMTARRAFGAAVLQQKVYAVGGWNGAASQLDLVEVFDPAAQEWTVAAPLQVARSQHALLAVDEHLWVIGGWSHFMRTQGDNLNVLLELLKADAVATNKEWAKRIGINPAAAITCVKPSGTVSQLTDAASGIHARHNEYYIRTVRADRKDPMCQFMIDKGFPAEPCVMRPDHTMVFSFPQKAVGSVTRNDMTAIEHLELWLTYQRHWCEHKPSITVTVREHEWMEVGAWVYAHFDEISGISFLPHSDHTYQQAPYQDCTAEQYEAALAKLPKSIDWSELTHYEKSDTTKGTQTFACSGDKCEVVDLTT